MAKSKKVAEATEGANTVYWNALANTPSEYCKDFKRSGGFQGTSIDPTYRIRKLTEMFGPCGVGWGFVQEDQWSDAGSGAYVVYVRGYLWYMHEGERCQTMSHTGGTVCDRAPDEAYKMSETDALGKCCLDLGMAADVYMGIHDGDKYQDTRDAKYTAKPAEAGRRQAGTNPSNAPKAAEAVPATAIAEKEFDSIAAEIQALPDDVAAMHYSQVLFNRMLLSKDLDPAALSSLAEKMLVRRAALVGTPEMIVSVRKRGEAYGKMGWMTKETIDKIVSVCERRLGVTPKVKE
jgi:hypothetical protein